MADCGLQKIRDQTKNDAQRNLLLEGQLLGKKQGPIVSGSLVAAHPVEDRALTFFLPVQYSHSILFHVVPRIETRIQISIMPILPNSKIKTNRKVKYSEGNMDLIIKCLYNNTSNIQQYTGKVIK